MPTSPGHAFWLRMRIILRLLRDRPRSARGYPGGDTVWIADLAGVGRFLTLICADMDYDKSGHWLIRNVAVDWLHAPIMDKSIACRAIGGGKFESWIVERAYTAAKLGVPRVIVTNSLFLTLRMNVTNAQPGSSFPVLKSCVISFMLDQKNAPLAYREIAVKLPATSLLVPKLSWRDAFAPFPPPVKAA
jgi:hypothetical protein